MTQFGSKGPTQPCSLPNGCCIAISPLPLASSNWGATVVAAIVEPLGTGMKKPDKQIQMGASEIVGSAKPWFSTLKWSNFGWFEGTPILRNLQIGTRQSAILRFSNLTNRGKKWEKTVLNGLLHKEATYSLHVFGCFWPHFFLHSMPPSIPGYPKIRESHLRSLSARSQHSWQSVKGLPSVDVSRNASNYHGCLLWLN